MTSKFAKMACHAIWVNVQNWVFFKHASRVSRPQQIANFISLSELAMLIDDVGDL